MQVAFRAGRGRQRSDGLGDHAPPLEGKGHPADVGTGTEVSDFCQVAVEVVDEGALEAQGLQEPADALLQAAGAVDPGPERLGDAQVQAHHNHLQLSEGGSVGQAWRGVRAVEKPPSPLGLREGHGVQGRENPASSAAGWARPGTNKHGAPFPKPVLRQASCIHLSSPPHSAEPSSDSGISE